MFPSEKAKAVWKREWDDRVHVAQGVRYVMEYRPPVTGETYLVGDWLVVATTDWASVCQLVVIDTVPVN